MILYALKCDEGYIKISNNGLKTVSIQHASVFTQITEPELDSLCQQALEKGRKGLCLVELQISEKTIKRL